MSPAFWFRELQIAFDEGLGTRGWKRQTGMIKGQVCRIEARQSFLATGEQ